jgi:enoyl-CoA hydratase/carnithine racemase
MREGRERVERLNRLVLRLVDFARPTIANGRCFGWAPDNLVLCSGLLGVSDRAKFGEFFARIGLVTDGGGTDLWCDWIGRGSRCSALA